MAHAYCYLRVHVCRRAGEGPSPREVGVRLVTAHCLRSALGMDHKLGALPRPFPVCNVYDVTVSCCLQRRSRGGWTGWRWA